MMSSWDHLEVNLLCKIIILDSMPIERASSQVSYELFFSNFECLYVVENEKRYVFHFPINSLIMAILTRL